MNELRWGIVGTGDVSASIVPDFALVPEATVTAVCSRSQARAEAFARKHGIERVFAGLENMLCSGAVDAVYIATPHGTHHEIAMRALEAGVHVMIEKPIATNHALAKQIFDRGAERGLFVMEAMWTKFSPTIRGLIRTVSDGAIGDVRSVRASFGVPFPRGIGSRWSAELGGSTLLDQGIYAVTVASLLMGDARSVTGNAVLEDGVDVTVHADLTYAGDRFAQIAASAVEFIDLTASISGTRGWITLAAPFWASNSYTVHNQSAETLGGHTHTFEIEGAGFAPMIREATTAVLAGLHAVAAHNPDDTLATFRTLDLIRSSVIADAS